MLMRSRVTVCTGASRINPEADKRLIRSRNFVAARENPGDLLGQDLLEKMKAQLKANK